MILILPVFIELKVLEIYCHFCLKWAMESFATQKAVLTSGFKESTTALLKTS